MISLLLFTSCVTANNFLIKVGGKMFPERQVKKQLTVAMTTHINISLNLGQTTATQRKQIQFQDVDVDMWPSRALLEAEKCL